MTSPEMKYLKIFEFFFIKIFLCYKVWFVLISKKLEFYYFQDKKKISIPTQTERCHTFIKFLGFLDSFSFLC